MMAKNVIICLQLVGRGGDCGIFVLKWMELMAHNVSIKEMTQGHAELYRYHMVVDLYAFAVLDALEFAALLDKENEEAHKDPKRTKN